MSADGTPGGEPSPWARPSGADGTHGNGPERPAHPAPGHSPYPPPDPLYRYTGTRPLSYPPPNPPGDVVASGPAGGNRALMWIGLGGGGVVIIGLIIIALLAASGVFSGGPSRRNSPFAGSGEGTDKPPLAVACPASSGEPVTSDPEPAPPGPRLADEDAGISYAQLGPPWKGWDNGTWSQGTLGVEFRTGFYIVTETYAGGTYLASVLSGKVSATVGDSLTLNLECAGRQVSEDVRNSYYPRPNTKQGIKDERTTLGGRPAWVSVFHLTFAEEGLDARGETVAVVLVDVGRPTAAILYLSIPDTHKQLTPAIDTLIASVRPI